MKRIMIFILTLALSAVLFGCGKKSVTEQLVGSWGNDDGDIVAFYENGNMVCIEGTIGNMKPINWAYADGQIALDNGVGGRTSKSFTINGDEFILDDDEIWHRLEN